MRSFCAAPYFATGLRPRLKPAPTASRSVAGRRRWIANEAPHHAARLHEARQKKLSRLVLPPPHPRLGSHCSAAGNNWGGFALAAFPRSPSLPLAPARSARSLEGKEKVRAFLPQYSPTCD